LQLQYVYTHPAYCRETLLFFGCLFGISFIILGSMAGNAINFAIRILEAANVEVTNGAVRGIAVAVSVFSCFIHTFSRRGGIWLNNLLAMIKLCILLLIIFSAIIYSAGKFPKSEAIDRGIVVDENLGATKSFKNASNDANGYAQAFLAIIFAYSGFEQPNYVLGEIGRPHRKYPASMVISVSLVCLLYLAVNISYVSKCFTLIGEGASSLWWGNEGSKGVFVGLGRCYSTDSYAKYFNPLLDLGSGPC
jgi:amino acid transporter